MEILNQRNTVNSVAKEIGVSAATIYRLVNKGLINTFGPYIITPIEEIVKIERPLGRPRIHNL